MKANADGPLQMMMSTIAGHSVGGMRSRCTSKCGNNCWASQNRYEPVKPSRSRNVVDRPLIQPLKKTDEEISGLAKIIIENYFDAEIQATFLDLSVQL